MKYKIESATTTKPTGIEVVPLIIPLTDETGKWKEDAMGWFCKSKTKKREKVNGTS
jgi:hypothetical protein